MQSGALLKVLSDLPSSSSGTGCSYYMTRCARKALLNAQLKELGEPDPGSYNTRVGSLFHKLLELYYGGNLADVILPVDDSADFDNDPVQEALRLFAGYRQFFHPGEWNVVEVEQQLPFDDRSKEIVERIMGVAPFTLRIDAVVDIQAEHMETFNKNRGLSLEPGVYLVDHKSADKKDASAQEKYDMSEQFASYITCYNAVAREFGWQEAKGMIVNRCVRHKDLTKRDKHTNLPNSFLTFFVPPPTEEQMTAIRNYFQYKAEYLKTGRPDLSACWDYGKCWHYTTGRCNRI